MAVLQLQQVVRRLRQLTGRAAEDQQSDRQLLERFAAHRDRDAFAELVRRHGPLVLGACRRLLRDEHDADDAFQATFVVLARKAASVRWRDSVSHWLYEVACRIALKARTTTYLRQRHERQAAMVHNAASERRDDLSWQDVRSALDEELAKLPAKFRAPLVLCYLEGKSRDEAAQELGWSEGAVKGMLERGRALLRDRLARRGLTLSAGLLAGTLLTAPASAAVPAGLFQATVASACSGTTAALAAPVAALSEGVIRAMFWTKLKIAAAVLLAAGVASGAGYVGQQTLANRGEEAAVAEPANDVLFENFDLIALLDDQAADDQEEKKPQLEKPDLAGVIQAVAADGKSITLALPPQNKGEAATTLNIKLTDATKITYVGVDSEKLTVGYMAAVWLQPGSKDVANGLRLGLKKAGEKGDKGEKADLVGKVTAVGKDSITIETLVKKDGVAKTHQVKLTPTTKVAFTNVEDGVKTPAVGFLARVVLAAGSQDTAAAVTYSGNKKSDKPKPEQPNPNNKPKPEAADPNAKPKPEKPDPNNKPKPEQADPNAKPKPEKPDPNNKPKPEAADPNAKPKPEKPDPNNKPKPEKVDPNAKPAAEKTSTLILNIGATQVLQLSNKQPIKEVFNEKETVAKVSIVPNDPTRVLVTGLTAGITRITLVGADGSKEIFIPRSEKSDK